ncbi:ALG5 [Candida pseudojiufengensis]|uniref:ALG5 n=1 Tax=Candida pseudojiufengensis TaxID=497109 RepID=UPI002224E7FA|nr:ALG5 [Candida pseudojiufengensis]KAI5966726.1 ALG5 [Candida pseudojiufengensis]
MDESLVKEICEWLIRTTKNFSDDEFEKFGINIKFGQILSKTNGFRIKSDKSGIISNKKSVRFEFKVFKPNWEKIKKFLTEQCDQENTANWQTHEVGDFLRIDSTYRIGGKNIVLSNENRVYKALKTKKRDPMTYIHLPHLNYDLKVTITRSISAPIPLEEFDKIAKDNPLVFRRIRSKYKWTHSSNSTDYILNKVHQGRSENVDKYGHFKNKRHDNFEVKMKCHDERIPNSLKQLHQKHINSNLELFDAFNTFLDQAYVLNDNQHNTSSTKCINKTTMYLYISVIALVLLLAVYAVIILFSHTPRLPIEGESTYKTNDNLNKSYPLPPRSTSKDPIVNPKYELSIIIPCYNETKRLGKMLDESIEYLEKHYNGKYEIIIVDDGSSDGTSEYAIKLANQHKLTPHIMKVIQLAKNRGKGGAVTHGLLHSQGKYSLFADADGATQFSDISKLLEFLNSVDLNQPAVAIGSRAHMVNTDAVVKRSLIRNFLMYGLHTLVYIFGIRKIQDTQCGFKMFNSKAIQGIFPHMHTERWIFDVEVLLLGELQNMKMKEVAVNWQEIDGSKIDIARDSIEMAIDLVVTRLAYLSGIYKLDECGRANKKNV